MAVAESVFRDEFNRIGSELRDLTEVFLERAIKLPKERFEVRALALAVFSKSMQETMDREQPDMELYDMLMEKLGEAPTDG